MSAAPSPIQAFLAPLTRLALRHSTAEGHVLWAEGGDWVEQDDVDLGLDGEEIAFYAEGLMEDGFGLIWQAVVDSDTPAEVEHILLFFWENGASEAPPDLPQADDGWKVTATGRWPG